MTSKLSAVESIHKKLRVDKIVLTKLCTTTLSRESPTREYLAKTVSEITNKLASIESLQRKAL